MRMKTIGLLPATVSLTGKVGLCHQCIKQSEEKEALIVFY